MSAGNRKSRFTPPPAPVRRTISPAAYTAFILFMSMVAGLIVSFIIPYP